MAEELNSSLEYTSTWVVAVVCFVIVLLSLCAERALHKLGKYLKHEKQDALFEALQKLKEELMLLGFISLLLTVFQGSISHICIPSYLASHMLPCKRETSEGNNHEHYSLNPSLNNRRQLLSAETNSDHCLKKGKVPLLSLEALHHLHIFIFVLAVVHVIFCVTTMVLGGARIRQWKHWEDSVRKGADPTSRKRVRAHHHEFLKTRGVGYWRKAAVIGWVTSFFKQFYGSVTKSDYIALRQGFIKEHCPGNPDFDFHTYMMRTLEIDFRKIVGISWYLWLFVVLFLLLNVEGWHTYFWLAFLPLILLLLVGSKLEHIITTLAQEVTEGTTQVDQEARVKPSDEHFWFNNPRIVLILIHFILFQNSFEIAFFFWIWSTYGIHSCIMEKLGYIIPRLIMGVIVQVLCSYSTLPLYVIVTQMGTMFKEGMFNKMVQKWIGMWAGDIRSQHEKIDGDGSVSERTEMRKMVNIELSQIVDITQQETVATQETVPHFQPPFSSSQAQLSS
ncbi:PREDICTED: MLO-like protein 13 [Prunus mume]|uniref:MLO-like protein n=1 Tax=Prunus mume TaxID=102107 RepID=A0ABM1LJ18_PRUMU|nr:PREDICTED: MLO-like protein 13 [Prunus mume]